MTPSTSSLRVLLVGDYDDDPRLGSAKVVHKLREELREAGHVCDALFKRDLGVRPRGRHARQLISPVLSARAIRRAERDGPYDVVDAASAEGLWYGAQKKLGMHRRTALICRSHGLEHLNYARMIDDSRAGLLSKPWIRRVWYPLSRLSQVAAAARLADRLILLNETDRQFALSRGWQPSERINVVPHGVSTAFVADRPAQSQRGAGMLFCGSWDQVKGVSYLVDAVARLADAGCQPPLTILGPGLPARDVLACFREDTRRLITVTDRVSEGRVVHEYRRHDLLVFPSTYEGFGLVVVEGMSQGLPVVATTAGCASELVRDGQTGVRVPPRDAAALASAIRQLMAAPDERRRLGDNAARAVAEMTWRETARRTVDVYRRALDGSRRS